VRVARSAALVAAIPLLLCGCLASNSFTAPASSETEPESSRTSFEDGLLTYEPAGEGHSVNGMLSSWTGLLDMVGGCLSVDEVPIVLPSGATWDGRTLHSDNKKFVLGDPVVLGGGRVEGMQLPVTAPDQCRSTAPFVAAAIDFVG
jgi:hypothetical protein